MGLEGPEGWGTNKDRDYTCCRGRAMLGPSQPGAMSRTELGLIEASIKVCMAYWLLFVYS
jgi:hypothetical protein